jgi:uncharacterized membrane protein
MNKILVAVFGTETAAYEGLSALKDLHTRGDITLYATAVIMKEPSGAVSIKQTADRGPIGTALGMLTGGLVGLLAGPAGVAAGFAAGGAAGLVFDLAELGIDTGFLDEVSKALSPVKTAVLAEVQETWTTPVDTRLEKLGAVVFRRLRSEVIEDQMARESAAFATEMKQLRDELAQATTETKAAVQREITAAKAKLEAAQTQARAKAEQSKHEMEAKIAALREQINRASDRQKTKIDKRISAVKEEYGVRSAKLEQAGKLIKEALTG